MPFIMSYLILCLFPFALFVFGMAGGLMLMHGSYVALFGIALLAIVYSIMCGTYLYKMSLEMAYETLTGRKKKHV